MSRVLTEMQQAFLDALFDEAKGDIRKAMNIAGYSSNYKRIDLVDSLREEIAERTQKFIANSATKAAYTMYDVLEDPTQLGTKEKIVAAKDILDRSGFSKTDKVEVKAVTPLFILPAKADEEEDD